MIELDAMNKLKEFLMVRYEEGNPDLKSLGLQGGEHGPSTEDLPDVMLLTKWSRLCVLIGRD